jgi:uncharacterized membrane protein
MFIDNLALTEALILFAGAILTYTAVMAWWAMRKNSLEGVKSALKGSALPLAAVGFAAVILGLWEEMVWPYPAAMGGYNILFNDVTLMFGMVVVAFAFSAYLNLKLQYVGLLAFLVGAVTAFYGWTAYGYNYTKEPFDFLLLYAGFSAAGIFAFPATIVLDYYTSTVATSETIWRSSSSALPFRGRPSGVRAVQKLGLDGGSGSEASTSAEKVYRMPFYVHFLVLAFPLFMALAAIAAWWFLGTTIPGHLTPGQTP